MKAHLSPEEKQALHRTIRKRDFNIIRVVLNDIFFKRKGFIAHAAKEMGVSREGLYCLLTGHTTPRLDTFFKILNLLEYEE